MADQKFFHTLINIFIFSTFHGVFADQKCDISKCEGPLQYYKDIHCTPIYTDDSSCCPVAYNCDSLKERSTDQCYINGHVYELNETLRSEDAAPCDMGCVCSLGYDGIATFNCAVVDCFQRPVKSGCYRNNSLTDCCPGEEVCPQNPSDRARCEVDGKTYLEGDYFTPESDPSLYCVCQPGYKGENVEPFCRPDLGCRVELHGASNIRRNCAPVYYSTQKPSTDCSVFSRCQNNNDTVIPGNATQISEPGYNCTFGNLILRRGDELNSATDYNSVCVRCVCQVPPVPTCQRLPDDECDVTVHGPFDNFSK